MRMLPSLSPKQAIRGEAQWLPVRTAMFFKSKCTPMSKGCRLATTKEIMPALAGG